MRELRPGWTVASLNVVAENLDSQRIPINATERAKRIGDVPYYGATGRVGTIDKHIFNEELVLLGEDGAPFLERGKPKAYLIDGPAWVNNHAHVLRGRAVINRYLLHYLNHFNYLGYANGTTRLKLTQAQMNRIPVPVAPLAEQERIVAAIEEQFSRLDAGIAGLTQAHQKLSKLRRAVLSAALAGRLVAQDPDELPATSLLSELGIQPEATDELPPLPPGWSSARIGSLSTMSLGKMLDRKTQTGNHPTAYLRNVNVRWFHFDLSDLATMDIKPEELERVSIRTGDLVVCEGGEPGRCAVWRGPEAAIQKALHRVRPHGGVSGAYLALVLAWWSRQSGFDRFVTGTTIKHIPKEKLRLLPVPLPPRQEQIRIVEEVERQLTIVDACERVISIQVAHSDVLRTALLKMAFNGALVPQDPTDEPARVLLERIRDDQGPVNVGMARRTSRRKSGVSE